MKVVILLSRVTTVKTFRQYDSRWGKHYYPNATYNMHSSGCGPTSCADVIASHPSHGSVTPETIRKYMLNNGYCAAGKGTYWSGIGAALKKYGFTVINHETMPAFFKEMAKNGRRGIILFGKGTRGGVTWTTGGHFLAVSGHKVSNGKNYLYMHDPGGRRHDGWYCYETTMKGLVKQVWSCYIKNESSIKKETAKTPVYPTVDLKKGSKGEQVKRLQKCLNKLMKANLTVDGIFGDKTLKAVKDFQKKYKLAVDGIVGTKTRAKIKSLMG